MDQIKLQSEQPVSDPQTCRDTICPYCFSFYSCFSDYLECDRRFLPMSIVPYQVYSLKQQNPLVQPITKNSSQTFEFNRVPQDNMLAQPQQSSRWQQVKTCNWWKRFLCCPYPQDEQMEMETDYDLKQSRFVGDQKRLNRGGDYASNNEQKMFAKGVTKDQDNIIFLDDEMHDDGISVYEMQKNSKPVILFAQPVKVNQKQQLGEIGIKRRNKTNSNQTKSNSGSEVFSPILKSKANEQYRKISSDLTLSSSDNVRQYPSNPNSRIISNIRTQSFDQSHSNNQLNINNNKQDTDLVFPQPDFNQKDRTMKRKKRNNNPFQDLNGPQQNYNATQEQAPEDLSKKRRRRRKDVHQDQKEKEERANKRGKEDMQIVIFQEDQM